MTGIRRIVWLSCVLAAAMVHEGWAQPAPDGEDSEQDESHDRIAPTGPWTEGVSVADMKAANELLLAGNVFLRDAFFREAAARYREAIAIWDHPAFHFNLAMAQRALDQPIEAHRSLGLATRHGPAALGQSKFEHAERMRALLEEQLGHVEVICEEAGAEVTLDGEPLFTGPGARTVLVRPGPHQLVARKAGRIPATEPIAPAPGEHVRVELSLRFPDSVIATRRWAAWKPWAVVGASAVFFAGAAYFDRTSSRGFDRFDGAFSQRCGEGCGDAQVPAVWVEELFQAETEQRVARAAYIAGGAVLATGVVLVYLNRERVIRVSAGDTAGGANVTFAPMLSPRGAGLTAALRF
jgi:hypothetical protein